MNLVKQGFYSPEQIPGLGLRIFGKKIRVGKWLGGVIRKVGDKMYHKLKGSFLLAWLADDVQAGFNWVADQIDTSLVDSGLNGSILLPTVDITASEQQILNKWVLIFDPFAEKLLDEVDAALQLKDLKSVLVGINAVLNKIDAIQDHYNATTTVGLSANAMEQRNAYIYTVLEVVHNAAVKGLEKVKGSTTLAIKEVNFAINNYNFQPLFSQTPITTVISQNYVISPSKLPTNPGGVITLPTFPGGVITIPKVPINTGGIPTKEGTNDTTGKDDEVLDVEIITDVPENTPNNSKNSRTTKIVVGGLILLALAAAATKAASKKKEKKKPIAKKATKNK
ncbi:hypothetical protein Q763_01485 [Flavobacterium beibuense F44-8]|uniref:Uncharacterized protein n=1 Tax=Flavobacterium beibuense F44-8 TaxID=1406840 RepID=A0A0A2LVP7_9FLAO|nr:hypothetical protein [Flavobacterium beibuense]KGO84442.1 hypothetical protein Q763_01485 [Flavobacterium beibuense F44-8]